VIHGFIVLYVGCGCDAVVPKHDRFCNIYAQTRRMSGISFANMAIRMLHCPADHLISLVNVERSLLIALPYWFY